MFLLLHALIPCLGAYNILPSSSVWACWPQPLPKPVRAMESRDTEKKKQILGTESINTCNANRSYTNRFAAHLCCRLVATQALSFFESLGTTILRA